MYILAENKKIEAKPGDTILTALRRAGYDLPTLCHLDCLPPEGSCRLCVVEVEGAAGLMAACSTPVAANMKISLHSPAVLRARTIMIDLLLARHRTDCPSCTANLDCRLQSLSRDYGSMERWFWSDHNMHVIDASNPAFTRDASKCILCGRCVRICSEGQGIAAIDFIGKGSNESVAAPYNYSMKQSDCISCGACVAVCPTAALAEKNGSRPVDQAMDDPQKTVVALLSPSLSITIGEEFAFKPGMDVNGLVAAALKYAGFDKVVETSFACDTYAIDLAAELAGRIHNNDNLPLITTNCSIIPEFIGRYYPEFVPNLSTSPSPLRIMAGIVEESFGAAQSDGPRNVFTVSISTCLSEKLLAGTGINEGRESCNTNQFIDAALSARELAHLFKRRGLDLHAIAAGFHDDPFGERSTSAKMFATTGGATEAMLRCLSRLQTGEDKDFPALQDLRGMESTKFATAKVGNLEIGLAVAGGLRKVAALLDEIRKGRTGIHFMELAACHHGCISGPGAPKYSSIDAVKARQKSLYNIDRLESLKNPYNNKSLERVKGR